MPIVDIEFVRDVAQAALLPPASELASVIGAALGTPAGRTWVKLHVLPPDRYAENDAAVGEKERPVFLTILHARPPQGPALAGEIARVTEAVAKCCACPAERVHIQYAPGAAGRQSFGGRLVA